MRTVDLDANVGVAPSSVRGPAVPGQRAAREGSLRGSIAMLMVGAKVLFNSAKMLKMGVLVVLMHNYRDQETKRDVKQLFYPLYLHCITVYSSEKVPESAFIAGLGDVFVKTRPLLHQLQR